MAREAIFEAIDRELARLQQVRDLFTDDSAVPAKAPGRPGRSPGAKRQLSEEARQRIAAGQKKRWAAAKAKSE